MWRVTSRCPRIRAPSSSTPRGKMEASSICRRPHARTLACSDPAQCRRHKTVRSLVGLSWFLSRSNFSFSVDGRLDPQVQFLPIADSAHSGSASADRRLGALRFSFCRSQMADRPHAVPSLPFFRLVPHENGHSRPVYSRSAPPRRSRPRSTLPFLRSLALKPDCSSSRSRLDTRRFSLAFPAHARLEADCPTPSSVFYHLIFSGRAPFTKPTNSSLQFHFLL